MYTLCVSYMSYIPLHLLFLLLQLSDFWAKPCGANLTAHWRHVGVLVPLLQQVIPVEITSLRAF